MRISALILSFLVIAPTVARSEYDHQLAIGDWLSYEVDEQGDVGLYYMRIEEDLGGAFGYKFHGSEARVVHFTNEQVLLADGLLVIAPSSSTNSPSFEIRIVVSAYDVGWMIGVMYFYQNVGGVSTPFNSFFLQMVQQADPAEVHENSVVEAVRQRFSGTQVDESNGSGSQ